MTTYTPPSPHRRVALACTLFFLTMFATAFAAVPFYNWFCRVTGYGGTPRVATQNASVPARPITIRFDSNVAGDLPWRFAPKTAQLRLPLGQSAVVTYEVENLSSRPTLGMAVFNVSPAQTGAFFNKLACFCFTQQPLGPYEKRELAVQFFVDPALAQEKGLGDLDSLTLSYTFYAQNMPATRP